MEYNDKNATEEIAKIAETENLNEEAEFETEDKPRGFAKIGHAVRRLGTRNIAVRRTSMTATNRT